MVPLSPALLSTRECFCTASDVRHRADSKLIGLSVVECRREQALFLFRGGRLFAVTWSADCDG